MENITIIKKYVIFIGFSDFCKRKKNYPEHLQNLI